MRLPSAATGRPGIPKLLGWLLLSCLAAGCFWLRAAHHDGAYQHYDESIIVGVVASMKENRNLDTNWDHCRMPREFGGIQFNFSAYHIAARIFLGATECIPGPEAARWRDSREGLIVFRLLSVLLSMTGVGLAGLLAWRLSDGEAWTTLLAATLVGIAPILVQDAHYGRPEAFVTTLLLGVILLVLPRGEDPSWPAIAGAAFGCGVLIATKVTFLSLGWIPAIPVLAAAGRSRSPIRVLVQGAVVIGALTALGFFAGAPYAVLEPRQYMYGVRRLMQAYQGELPPHGHPGGGAVWDLVVLYFGATLGWLTLAFGGLGAVWLIVRKRWSDAALLVLPIVLMVVLFGRQSVFFERNLSHIVPLGLVLAALGVVRALRRLPAGPWCNLGAAGLLVLLAWQPASVSWRMVSRGFSGAAAAEVAARRAELESQFPSLIWISSDWGHWWKQRGDEITRALEDPARRPVVFDGHLYGDGWTKASEADLRERLDLVDLGTLPTDFPEVPTCTLQTYLSPTHRLWLVRGKK